MELKKYNYFIGKEFIKLKKAFEESNMFFYDSEKEFLKENGELENDKEHCIGYYLLDDNEKACASGSITINPDKWNTKYIGNFSYQVLRKERGKGYGRCMLDCLIREAVNKYDMKEGYVCCDDRNYKSASVIEYNGGVLQYLEVVNYPKEITGVLPPEFDRYYYIDLIKSINNKNETYRSYRDAKMECKVLEEDLTVIPAIEEVSDLKSKYDIKTLKDIKETYIDILKTYKSSSGDVRKLKEIIESKICNNDYELLTLLSFHIRKNNIPTLLCIIKEKNNFKPLLQINIDNKKIYIDSNFKVYENIPQEYQLIKKTISVLSSNNFQNMLDTNSKTPNMDAFLERLNQIKIN